MVKAVLRVKFVTVSICIEKGSSEINTLTLCVEELKKEEQTKPKANRRKETIKIRAEINEIGKKIKSIKQIIGSLKRSTILKDLRLQEKRHKITKIENEIRAVMTNLTKMQRILREYYKQLYANELDKS